MNWAERRDVLKNKVREIVGKVEDIKPRLKTLLGTGFSLGVSADIDAAIRVVLDDSFLKVIDRAILGLDQATDKINQKFEDLVQQIFDNLIILEKRIEKLIEKVFQNLSDLIKDLKKNLVDPIVDAVFELEEKIFEDINQVLDKIFDYFTGTVKEFKDNLYKILNPIFNPLDVCRQQLRLSTTPNGRLTHIDLFNLFECNQLRKLDDGGITVRDIQEVYALLQLESFKMTCLGRGAPSLQEIYMRKWLKYGQLFEIWKEFSDTMTPQQAYDEAIRRLDQARAEYQSKISDIDSAQNTANDAVSRANKAQVTADSAQKTADSAVETSVKNVKFFPIIATNDTVNETSDVLLNFPERVDAVALESIMNDGFDMQVSQIDRVSETVYKVSFVSARGQGVRWLPSLRFIGIQVQR